MSFPPPPADAPASAHRGHHSRGDRDRGHYQAADSRRHFSADAGDAPRGDGQFHARPDGDIMRPSASSRRDFARDDRRDVSRDDRRSEYRRGRGEFDMGTSGLPPSHGAVPGLARNQHPEQPPPPPPLPTVRIGGVLPGSIPPPPPLPPVQAPTYATTPTAPAALESYRPQHDHRHHRSGNGDAAAGADRRQERHARDRETRRSGRDERGDRDRDGSRRKRSSRRTRSYSSSVSASSRSASGSSRSSLSSDDSYARRREKRHRRGAKDKSRREKRDKYRSERKHRSSRHRRSISSDSSYTSDSASSATSSGSSYSSASDRRRSRRHRSSGKSSSRRTRESRTERKSHDRLSRRDRPDAATVDGAAAPQQQQLQHQQPPRSAPHRAMDDADVRRQEQQALRLDGAAPAMPLPTTSTAVAASETAQQVVVLSREDERREQRRREKEAERRQRELDKQRKRRQREADEARRKKEKAQRHKRRRAASFSGSDVSGDEDDDTAGDVSSSSMSESDASSSRSGRSDADYDLPPTGAGGSSEAFWAGFGHGAEDGAATGAPSAAGAAAASAAHANDDEAFIPREPTDQELGAHSKMLTARLRLQPGEELPSAAELADVDDGTSLTIALQITRLRRADAVGPHATAAEPDTPLTPYLIYHMLRNDGFPRKIVMMVPKSIAAPRIDDDPEGGAGIIDKEYQGYHLHSLRCLVEVDGVDSKRRLLYRFGRAAMPNSPPGIVMRVSETTSFVVTAMPCPPGTKVYAHVNNPTTLVVTQACVHMLGPVWPRHFFRPRGATGIAETPHDGPFMQFKGPIRIALPSPGASSLPGTYTPRSAVLSPNDGMHGGSRMRRANEGVMLSAGGGGGHGTPRGLGPRIDARDRPYPSPSLGPSLASVGSVGRSPHLHSDSRGGLSSYDAAPMDGPTSSRPPRRHDYTSDFDARDSRRGEERGRGFDRPDRPPSHHTGHSHRHQNPPHLPQQQQQQQPPYGRFGGDDFPRHSERPQPRDPDHRDYPTSERGLMIPTVRVGPRVDVGQGMPSSAASHTLSAHSGSLRGGDHFERPERYREGDADRFDRGGGGSHRSGAPVGHHLGDRRRERSPASYRGGGGAYPDRGHGDGGRDDMHRGRGELHGATGAREFHHGPRDGPMSSRPRRDGHDRRHHYESGNGHGDMAAAHRLPSWSQQQQQQQHSLRSPIDAQLAPGDAQYHQRPGTAQPREESTIRGEDIYSF